MNKLLRLFSKNNLIKLFLLFLPLSIILGNAAINLNIFILIILYFLSVNFEELIKKYKYQIILLFLSLLVNIFFSNNPSLAFRGSLSIIKMVLFFLSLSFFFSNRYYLNCFISSLFYTLIFVIFDTYLQFFNGQDLFGFKISSGHGQRLSGPFGDEYIVGAFILKTIFFVVNFNFFKKNLLRYSFLCLSLIIVILSMQRMPIILLIASLILYLLFDSKINYKSKLISLFVIILIPTLVLINSTSFKKHLIDRTFEQIGIVQTKKEQKTIHYNFFDSQWGAHFLTAWEIFLDNKITGSGLKNFRVVCKDKRYDAIKSAEFKARCSTHPHNIYYELMSETGILGIAIFLFLLVSLYRHVNLFSLTFINKNPELIVMTFIFLWPIQTTGSLYSTWSGIFYSIYFAYFITKTNQ